MTSLLFAISVVLIRKSFEKMTSFSVLLTVTLVQNLVFWPLVFLFVPADSVSANPLGIFFFILAGAFHPTLSRLGYYKGIERLGASLNTSLIAIYPFFATIFAIYLLNEQPTIGILGGMCCLVFGGILLEGTMRNSKKETKNRANTKNILYPLIAAVFIGLGNVLRKLALNEYEQILVGVAVGSLVALTAYGLMILSSSRLRKTVKLDRDSFKFVGLAGVILCGAWVFNFYALSIEEVTVVSSLRSSTPLFVLLLSYFFLKKLERLSLRLLIGTLFISIGALIIIAS
jgi:drug/metabolite transporter (DMT)-like permease